ncbi:HNH endonuclease signature motif containing protein [Arthrobacter sp. 7Tela_A1]|uniref:HNH endonuclease signature motif containing protein n=1 Tax=Arthrobacter sp. 7Tela_A1 TaxID=3093745 RepID=UPI003BB5E00B
MTTSNLSVPEGFKLSRRLRDELPESERADARESLWMKSQGRCSLCNEPLPGDGSLVDVDHMKARKAGVSEGPTELKNLYLAHRSCNRKRQNLAYDIASRVIRFERWCTAKPRRSFEEVIEKYVPEGNQRVDFDLSDSEVTISFGTDKRTAAVYVDPATETKYFFMSVPVKYIQNDSDTQPRFIEFDHVRTLAIEFDRRPVHEPSNCRLVPVGNGLAELKQFDGQHKTTAQVLLGRREVPMKFYFNPSVPMIQELVVQIQQGIKKRPLSTTDTLKKLDDVIRDKAAEYKTNHDGRVPSEIQLVNAQPLDQQAELRKRLLRNFEYLILDDPNLEIRKYLSKKLDRRFPLTDTVLVTRIIRPLVCQDLLDVPLDNSIERETEREIIVQAINRITENMLTGKWNPQAKDSEEDIETWRARLFFKQGAIGWWLKSILVPALQSQFLKQDWKRLFIAPLNDVKQERLEGYIDIICGWDAWSTKDEDQLAALRSNTPSRTEKLFPNYSNISLQQEFSSH